MNRRQRRRQARRADLHPRTGQRIGDLTSVQLHQTLVSDCVQGYETPVPWVLGALAKIARTDRITEEEAFQRWRQEVRSLGAIMPGDHPAPRVLP